MTIAKLVLLILQISVMLQVLSLGLHATLNDVTSLFRRPGLLLRSLFSMNVVVPIAAVMLVRSFDLLPPVKIALVTLAVSPMPPLLPNKLLKAGGGVTYVYGLLVTVAILSIIIIPLTGRILAPMFNLTSPVPLSVDAKIVTTSILLPLGAGLLIHSLAPRLAERIGSPIAKFSGVTLVLALLPVLFMVGPKMLALIGNGTLAATLCLVIVGLAAGFLLGGPDPHTRAALSLASAARHPAVATALGTAMFPQESDIFAAVLLYTLIAAIVSIPYVIWSQRQSARFSVHAPAHG